MSWRLDPETGDYVLTDGAFEREDGLATAVYLRLTTQRGSWLDDPQFGSRLHELLTEKSAASAAKKGPAMVREALQPMVDDGSVRSVEVTAEVRDRGVALLVQVTDAGEHAYVFEVFQGVA